MIRIVHHRTFCEESTTFDNLSVGDYFVTQAQLKSLGNSAPINMKVSDNYAVSFKTGVRFKLAKCVLVRERC